MCGLQSCVDVDPQWLMFISLSSSSSAEKAEKLTGSHSRVRRLTRQAVWVLLNSGIVTKRTSWPSGPGRRRGEEEICWHIIKKENSRARQYGLHIISQYFLDTPYVSKYFEISTNHFINASTGPLSKISQYF